MSAKSVAVPATRQALMDAFWTLYKKKRIEKITVKNMAIGEQEQLSLDEMSDRLKN